MIEEEKLCKSCIFYQFKYGHIQYWQCKKGMIRLVDNKCNYYRKKGLSPKHNKGWRTRKENAKIIKELMEK